MWTKFSILSKIQLQDLLVFTISNAYSSAQKNMDVMYTKTHNNQLMVTNGVLVKHFGNAFRFDTFIAL